MISRAVKLLLLATAFTPLIYAQGLIYPFVLGKALFFRTIIELALVFFLILLIRSPDAWQKFKAVAKTPLFMFVSLFFVVVLASSFFAVDVYRAFWGEVERMEGVFGLLHYYAFFVMAVNVFLKKEWLQYLKISLVVGFIIAFYSFLQVIGFESFPFAFDSLSRANAFLGNSSFVGAHFLFVLGFAMIVFWQSLPRTFWRYFSLAMMPVSVAGILMSGTRGAMLGLFIGLLVLAIYFGRKLFKNKYFWLILGLLVVFTTGFLATKSHPVWQQIPGVDRLASFSLQHATVQTRLIAFNIGWDALKERPILGWGQDNFGIAYNKHFDPYYLFYENAWFDRAHNRLLDVAVMQGLLGLFVYLFIFGWIVHRLIKFKDFRFTAPMLFTLSAYFVQNLFLFDQINSYIMFFLVLAIITEQQARRAYLDVRHSAEGGRVNTALLIISGFIIIGSLYSVYAYNYVPYRQGSAMDEAQVTADTRVIDQLADEFLYPNNFAQLTIRATFMDFLQREGTFSNPDFDFLNDRAISAMEELVEAEPYFPRQYIRLSEAYNEKGRAVGNHDYYKKSEEVLLKALELAPKRFDIYYHLAFTKGLQGDNESAVETARKAVDMQPEVARAHYMLGLAMHLAGDRVGAEKEFAEAFRLKNNGGFTFTQDVENVKTILSQNMIYYVQQSDAGGVLRTVEIFRNLRIEELEEQLDIIENLAQSGQWSQLQAMILR